MPDLMPQKMKENPKVTDSIHTSGKLTRATGAYSARRLSRRSWSRHCARAPGRPRRTRNWSILVKPLRGSTTVSRAEISTDSTNTMPNRTATMWPTIIERPIK